MRLTIRQIETHTSRALIHCAWPRHGLPLLRIRLHRVHVDAQPCQRGFTLVELIMTMIVVGILAAVAIPRFFDTSVFQSRGAADQVKAALRYGQKVAIAQRKNVAVNITSPTSASDCGAILNSSGNIDCKISNRVIVASRTVTFNALGQPVPNTADSITVGTAPNDTVIIIEAETGYVHSP